MNGSLENEFVVILNGATAPQQLVDQFRTQEETLLDLELATKILTVRNSLPQHQFSSLKEIASIQGLTPVLVGAVFESTLR